MKQLSPDELEQLIDTLQTLTGATVGFTATSDANTAERRTVDDPQHARSLCEAAVRYFITGKEISLLFQGEGDERFGGIEGASDYLAEAIDFFQYLLTNHRPMKVVVPEDSLEIQTRIQALVNRL